MLQSFIIKSIITWFMFIPIAITNGIIREKFYKPVVGDLAAHQISTVIASAAFILLSYVMLKQNISRADINSLFLIGLMWVVMTILFEFGFGHYISKQPWDRLLADYNLLKGRVWGLFLILIFFVPYLISLLKKS